MQPLFLDINNSNIISKSIIGYEYLGKVTWLQ